MWVGPTEQDREEAEECRKYGNEHYTEAELEFMDQMEQTKRKHRGQFVVDRMKDLDDDVTDIVFIDGEAFQIKRATVEDVEEWNRP